MIRMLNYSGVLAMCCLLLWGTQPVHAGKMVADFEDLSPTIPYGDNSHYENGANLSGSFRSGEATFPNSHGVDDEWGWEFWSGWSYSNVVDTVTPGYDNQYAAYALEGPHGPNTYAVAHDNGLSPLQVTLSGAPIGLDVANTTYAARSMLHEDGFAKKFGGDSGGYPDWFKLTISGRDDEGDDTGSVPFYLADYRPENNADDKIVRDWTWVDLSEDLASDTRTLEFSLSSTDMGDFGMNTPAYFAVDNVTTSVPEPGSAALCGMALILGVGGYWLRVQRRRA